MATIRHKREFYRLWDLGLLGNRPRTWPSVEALRASGYSQPVVVRAKTPGWKTRYGVPIAEILDPPLLGGTTLPPNPTFNELLEDDRLLLQGEVKRGERGWELTYSTVQKPMKLALAASTRYATGLAAKLILDAFLCPSSRDDLKAIWDLYPDAVIEFGVYNRNLGDQPHRNTLIWEVRNY